MKRALTLWYLPLLACALTCGGTATVDPPDADAVSPGADAGADTVDDAVDAPPCIYLDDGVCDEPVNCPLGTDEADCATACDDPDLLWHLGAACAHRQPPEAETRTPAATVGTINLTGTLDRTLDVALGAEAGTRARHYRLFVPKNYDPALAWPLVIMMPGHRVDLYSLADYTQLECTAEANGFLLVYAEQEWRSDSFRWAWWTDWDWVSKPDTNPDVAFLRDLVDDVAAGWSVDRQQVYGVGHSRGGAMAYIAAFELGDLFAAVCSQSGFTEFGYDAHVTNYVGRKTPTMLVHGALDTDVNVAASDAMNSQLQTLGWTGDDLVYHRLDNVAHRWQPWMNQQMWDWLSSHTLPGGTP